VSDPVSIADDAAYWRKMYEERLALQEDGFTALLADRDCYRDALRMACADGWADGEGAMHGYLRVAAASIGTHGPNATASAPTRERSS
jgi:hypothetical protein